MHLVLHCTASPEASSTCMHQEATLHFDFTVSHAVPLQLDQAIKRLQHQTADLEQQQKTLSQQLQEETSRQPDAVCYHACAPDSQQGTV